VVVVAELFTRVVIVIVTVSLGFTVPTDTVTVRFEVFVAAVPLVVVAPVTSRRFEKESETRAFEAGAVPVFRTWMVKVKVSLIRAELGLTATLSVMLGAIVPVAVGVGGVPVTVEVGVPGEPVTVGVSVEAEGEPVIVGVAVFCVMVRVPVAVGVAVTVSVIGGVRVRVGVGVEVCVSVIWSGMTSRSPWVANALPGIELCEFARAAYRLNGALWPGAAFEIDQVMRDNTNRVAAPTNIDRI
jgi:hypothetical protein